jgi:inorganic pyrophosphatase
MDILVMVNEPTFSGCLIEARVIGLFRMRDRGENNYKILAVPHTDPLYEDCRELGDVPRHFLREVEHFFSTYKQLEGATVETEGGAPKADAIAEVRASVDRHRQAQEEGTAVVSGDLSGESVIGSRVGTIKSCDQYSYKP